MDLLFYVNYFLKIKQNTIK